MPIPPALYATAVEMLKAGWLPLEVYGNLVRCGAPPDEANACVLELLALKRAAEARDPARLRADAIRMLFYGASKEDLLRYFESVGVPADHATAEVDKLAVAARTMVACERCGQPTVSDALYFDPSGIRICSVCQSGNEVRAATQRAVESQENERNGHLATAALGALALSPGAVVRGFLRASASAPPAGPTTCPRCRLSSGLHRRMLSPQLQATLHPAVTYACGRCGTAIA